MLHPKCYSLAAAAIGALLLARTPAAASNWSTHRVDRATVKGQHLEVSLALNHLGSQPASVDFFAHEVQPDHRFKSNGARAVEQGFKALTTDVKCGASMCTMKVPLAELARLGVKPGGQLYIASFWRLGGGGTHQWGADPGPAFPGHTTGTSVQVPDFAVPNSRLRGPAALAGWLRPVRGRLPAGVRARTGRR